MSEALIEAYSIGWDNERKLNSEGKLLKKMVSDLRNEFEQLKRREANQIEEQVHQSMYEQIKQHNISRNKILEQTKAHIIRVCDQKVEALKDSMEGFIKKIKTNDADQDKKIHDFKV